jgi:hypothetical protein
MSLYRLTLLVVVATIVAMFAPTAAHAQYDYYSSGSFSFNQNNYPDLSQRKWKKPGTTSTPTRRSTTTTTRTPQRSVVPDEINIPISPLPYTRDQVLSKTIQSEFLTDLAGRGPAYDVGQMAKMIAQYDFVQVYAGMAKQQGLDSASSDSLIALWYGQTWAIANQKPLPTARQYQAIAKQMRDTKANSGTWAKMTNRARQTFIEKLAYPFVIQKANYEAYRREGKSAAMADMAQRVQAGMLKFGINMQTTQLTDAGLIES